MEPDYIVIDDFCPEADLVRNSALSAGISTWLPNKGEVGSSVYEGMGFWGDHAFMLRSLIMHTGRVVVPNSMFFRVTNVDMEEAYIHSDRATGDHTAIVYLSEHEVPYGTAFYKHKPTGWTEMPDIELLKELGVYEELKKDMVSRDPDKWEQTAFVEGKYNRGLVFKAPLFHSRFPFDGIGDTTENGRLIWASHFFKLNGQGQLL